MVNEIVDEGIESARKTENESKPLTSNTTQSSPNKDANQQKDLKMLRLIDLADLMMDNDWIERNFRNYTPNDTQNTPSQAHMLKNAMMWCAKH